MANSHVILQSLSIIDAIRLINEIKDGPLVLFAVDDEQRMQGTLTDGDVRRALLRGVSIDDSISEAIHRDFNYLRKGVNDGVEDIHRQRELKMRLVPVLDAENHICEIINLEKYRTKLPFDAVLMAGGKGERLRPLTEKTPKPLIQVGDKCIIDYNIDRLLSYGVKHISVTINYLGEQIEEHFQKECQGVKIATVREPHFLGTIGSVKFVDTFYNDTVLVMNSDLFTNIDYEDFYLHFSQNDADMSVAAVPYVVKVPYGVFNLDGREIKGVIE
ncbi:sugar phosphate nucleotidyltransferase, partial [Bacteroides sp.]|uniref:sugar phosphate nucleotidyltransferase n=1 Tax=Bacteroides sp. TaxID=29523 RepID=UPI0025886A02